MRSVGGADGRKIFAKVAMAAMGWLVSVPGVAAEPPIPLAVIGDSDSQGYQTPQRAGSSEIPRGGAYHATTFQWTEVLATLRGNEIALGSPAMLGMRGRVARAVEMVGLARVAGALGWEARAPIKRDNRHNFAYAGDGCADLFGGWSRQVPRLVRLMDSEPGRWQGGVVVIKIGGNDFANDVPNLTLLATDPASPAVRRKMDFCLGEIGRAVAVIHQEHPRTRIVLTGAFNNAHWERYFDQWHSDTMLANISKGLDYFDDALEQMVNADARLAFFDYRSWFDGLWGSRGPGGAPNYRVLVLAPAVRVANSGGDAPSNATLADGHAGLVWNAKWAQALVDLIRGRFGLQITPIADDEVLRFVLATGAFKNVK